jgi:hypothetical protein
MQQAEIIGKYEVPKCGKRCCSDPSFGVAFRVRDALGLALRVRLFDESAKLLKDRTGLVKAKMMLGKQADEFKAMIEDMGGDKQVVKMREVKLGFDLAKLSPEASKSRRPAMYVYSRI